MKKRQGHNLYLKLNSNIPFDTWKAQILVKIEEKIKLDYISYKDYDVSSMIPYLTSTSAHHERRWL